MKKKILLKAPIILGVALIIIFGITRVTGVLDKGTAKTITSSTLTDAIDISELSTAQFTYNGIAEMFKDEEKKKVQCHIKYNAKVKAGIDMKKVEFHIDKEDKTVKPILPDLKITSNITDETTLSFIPSDTSVELKDVLVICEEDAKNEALKSQELFASAEENLKSIIEGLLYPVLNPQGYKVVWK